MLCMCYIYYVSIHASHLSLDLVGMLCQFTVSILVLREDLLCSTGVQQAGKCFPKILDSLVETAYMILYTCAM